MTGRPSHNPTDKTRAEVEALSSFGTPQANIASYLGIDPKTLRKHYGKELELAEVKANAAVAKNLFTIATTGKNGPSVAAAIFWMKTRCGWRETTHLEHSGPNGGAIDATVKHTADDAFAQLITALDVVGRAKAAGSGETG